MTSISGVDFEDAWRERLIVDLEGLSVSVIDLRHLHANQLTSGRAKDHQDASILEEMIRETKQRGSDGFAKR